MSVCSPVAARADVREIERSLIRGLHRKVATWLTLHPYSVHFHPCRQVVSCFDPSESMTWI
ncbi:hypothetical protein NOCA150002 [metagenome]|uniref:Uncharacterized protein n=1 Tax=metagenome TaxID=256318 RepID=A0A2P2CKQ8_9ZZZZ